MWIANYQKDSGAASAEPTPATPSGPMKFNPNYYYGFGPDKSSNFQFTKKTMKKTIRDFLDKGILSSVFGINERDIDPNELNDFDDNNEEGDEDGGFFVF